MPTKVATGQQTIYDMNDIPSGTTPPTNPSSGALWLNKNDWNVYTYNGATWVIASPEYQISGRNIIRDSGRAFTNNGYPTVIYNLTQSPTENETMTVTLKGTLGSGKANFSLYNSGGSVSMISLTASDRGTDGIFRKTFNWKVSGSTNNTVHIYPMPNSVSVNSTIEWIVIERGTNKRSDWIPAPEDDSSKIEEITATLGNMANDNILDFKERQLIKDKLIDILGYALADSAVTLPVFSSLDSISTGRGSFYTARQSALNAGILPTDGIYSALATQYTNLKTYLEGLTPIKPWDCTSANSTKVISVTKSTFVDRFLQYYKAEKELASYTAQKLKENADNIDVGGTNLLPDTDFKKLNVSFAGNHTAVIDSSNKYGISNSLRIVSTGAGSTTANVNWTPTLIENGKEYTVSFYAKASVAVSLHARLDGGVNATNFNVTTSWQYFSVVLKGSTVAKFYLWLNASATCYISRLKLERGNKATDWSPNESDVDTGNITSKLLMDANSMSLISQNINLSGRVTFSTLGSDLKPMIVSGESSILFDNQNFIDWGSTTLPTSYTGLSGTAPTKVTSDNGTGVAVRFSTTAGADNYFYQETLNKSYYQYVTVEATFKLESGNLSGSGIMFRYLGSSGSVLQDWFVNFATEIPSPVTNKWYTVTKTFKRANATESSFTGYIIYPMASHSTINSSRPAKVIQYDSVKARPSTQSEIVSYEINTTTRVANGRTYIDGGSIITDSISTLSATVGTLTGGRIYGSEIEGARIYTSDTPSFWDANFTQRLRLTAGSFMLEGRGVINSGLRVEIDGYGVEIDGKGSASMFEPSPNIHQQIVINSSGITVANPTYPTSATLSKKTFGVDADEIYFGKRLLSNGTSKVFMGSWDSGQLAYNGNSSLTHKPDMNNSTLLYVESPNGIVINHTYSDARLQVGVDNNNAPWIRAMGVWERTWSKNTSNVPVLVNSAGTLARESSASKYKLLIEEGREDFKKILNLKPKTWFDKMALESYSNYLTKISNGEETDIDRWDIPPIERAWGLIAEDLVEAGLEQFVSYVIDENGNKELEGISYSHIWIMLIPLVKELFERIELLENNRG